MYRRRPSRSRPNTDNMVFKKNNTEEIATFLLKSLNQLREDGTFCDLTLRVGNKAIRVHKNVICACSSYFFAMLSDPFQESNQEEIVIKDIDADCLEHVIEFIYTGSLKIESKNVKQVLLTASFLQIESAEEVCVKFLENNLDAGNCIEYILYAGKNSVKSLLASSIKMAVINFHDIFYKNDYLEIEFDEFKLLIQGLKENGHAEDLIYSFILRWIHHSQETRIHFIQKLLENLEPLLISPDMLNYWKISILAISISNSWEAHVGNALENQRLPNDPNEQILVTRRLGTFCPIKIKIFTQAKHCEIYSLPETIIDGSYACNGYYIYHQGGWKGTKELLTESYVYHPTHKVWFPFVPLQQARAYHHSCVLNGKIYSVGGSDGFRALPSVEFIDLYTGQRGFTDPLPRAKERAGLALHDNSIYVVGGSDRGVDFKCIHRIDVREGKWQELAPSPYRAGANSCAVVGENIYTTHLDALQRYDIRANNWTLIFGQYKRYPHEVFSCNEILFGLFSDHIATYLPELGKWKNQRSLKLNLSHLKVSPNLRCPNVNGHIFDDNFEIAPFRWRNDHDDYRMLDNIF